MARVRRFPSFTPLAWATALALGLATAGCGAPPGDASGPPGGAGQAGAAPSPVVIASGQNEPGPIAADDSGVYWIDAGPSGGVGSIMRAYPDGSGVVALATHLVAPTAVALDADHVYWLSAGSAGQNYADAAVMSMNKDGSDRRVLVGDQPGASLLTVDRDGVYWVDSDCDPCSNTTTMLMKSALDGSSPVMLATLELPDAIAVDADGVYVSETASNSIEKIPKGGGSPVVLARDPGAWNDSLDPSALALYDGTIYWGAADAVMSVRTDGSGLAVVAPGRSSAWSLAADASGAYWSSLAGSSDTDGRIAMAPVDGGAVRTLATGQNIYFSGGIVAVGPSAIYWTTSGQEPNDLRGQGDVMMLPK